MKNIIMKFTLLPFLLLFMGSTSIYAEPTTIMPLGDSITYDNNEEDLENPRPTSRRTAYRSHLWYRLVNAGFEADFVGSRVAGEDITPPFDPDNEGHPGWSSYKLADHVYSYLSNTPANIVLLHIGTNDHRTSNAGVVEILDEIDRYERDSGNTITVIVALIIDREEPDPLIEIFNENLKETIGKRIRLGDKLTLVDMYNGAGLTSADYADNTHPNENGYIKMSYVWAKAILNPYTPGLHAFPYTLVDKTFITPESLVINTVEGTVEFTTQVPDTGIIF